MTLNEAYTYLDLLIDKADQPYFTNAEKDVFLNLAKTEWINKNYMKMESDEDSRSALSPLILTNEFELNAAQINSQDGLEDHFNIGNSTATIGYFVAEEYLMPFRHLYTLSVKVRYLNNRYVTAKSISTKDYSSSSFDNDPFNKSEPDSPVYSVLDNKIIISPFTNSLGWGHPWHEKKYVIGVKITSVMNPGLATLFDNAAGGVGSRWSEHQQNELVQIAARKMTGNIESSNYEVSQKEVENNM